ncbi:hypothetical protein BKA83DRAFT_4130846 [Pisolithus microcarpus]|nr:hypothetical protein BKA83DRAFT_4130846 [Pisolithus microcarpus]
MDSNFKTDYGYPSDPDTECAVDEEGEESGNGEEQTDGPFNLAELEILAHRWREWNQARKKEKPIILQEIYKEFAKMEKNHDLRPVERWEKEESQGMSSDLKGENFQGAPLAWKEKLSWDVWGSLRQS